MRLAATITPSQWNPFRGNSDAVDYQFMSPVYDQLFQFDSKLEPEPSLAESFTIAPDLRSITLKLRKGVKFQDGTAFNAAAVVANMNYGKANAVAISKPTMAGTRSMGGIVFASVRSIGTRLFLATGLAGAG